MRNYKKLLVVICVLSLLTVSCVFATVMAASTGNVADLNALIDAAENTNDPVAKYKAIVSARDYYKTVPNYETGYPEAKADLQKLCVDGADLLLDAVSANGVKAADA